MEVRSRQASGLFIWAALDRTWVTNRLWWIPVVLLMLSCGWWENYLGIKGDDYTKKRQQKIDASKPIANLIMVPVRCGLVLATAMILTRKRQHIGDDYFALFTRLNLKTLFNGKFTN